MALVFICYGRKNLGRANSLAEDLTALGHRIWLDQALTGGQAWWNLILSEIQKCDIFVFALDPESQESTACKREYSYASALGKSILPVMIADGVSVDLLPSTLAQVHYVDYRRDDDRQAWRTLVKALHALPPSRPLPDLLPPHPPPPVSDLGSLREEMEDPDYLLFDKQSVLVLRLKRELREAKDPDEVNNLLMGLRSRFDVYASVRDEIDSLLNITPQPVAPSGPPVQPRKSWWDRTINGLVWTINGLLWTILVLLPDEDRNGLIIDFINIIKIVISKKLIWLSLLVGFGIDVILRANESDIHYPAEFIRKPSWSIPAWIVFFFAVAWNEMRFRQIHFKLLFVFWLILTGYVIPAFAARDLSPASHTVWQLRFFVVLIPLFIFVTASKNERSRRTPPRTSPVSKPVSHKVTWFSLGIGVLVAVLISQSAWVTVVYVFEPVLATLFVIYVGAIVANEVISEYWRRQKSRSRSGTGA